ncbi:S9 family peptidase [Gammaproteobacteria bacterium]|nr:S9 family peptidase [Gammaproteobacteria bacterium]
MINKSILTFFIIFSFGIQANNLEPISYWDIQSASSPIVSPDNSLIIFSKEYIDKKNDDFINELWVMKTDGSDKRFFAKGENPKWSPNSLKIAYVKSDDNDTSQIYIKYLNNETESKITNHEKGIKDFAWSNDGKFFSFSSFNEYESDWKIDIPGKEEGVDYSWTSDPNVVTSMHWKSDGEGEHESGENHLYLVDSDGGPAVKISDWGNDYVSDLQWIDNANILFTGNSSLNDLEPSWQQTAIFVLNTKNKELSKISPETGVFTSPKVSKDGKKIVFIGHPNLEYIDLALDIWINHKNNNKVLTNNLSSSPGELFWLSDDKVVFHMDERGSSKLIELDVINQDIKEVIPKFNEQFYLSSVSNQSLYGVYANAKRPGEIASVNKSKLNKLTEFNELILSQYNLGETTEINYMSPDGTKIQGWYITPPNFDENKKYPLILIIHGGPHAMYRSSFNYLWHQFASDGYVVLYTNPRGSTGYGSDFANKIDKDYPGKGDLSDLLAGVDYVTDMEFINESKMYVQGCSGGGVLTTWVVGHDDRFAAAASLCPVTNWISMVGTTDIPAWTFTWFEKPFWEDPTEWLEHSPIMRTGFIKTPTLLMTGVLDIRTPMAQTEEMYIALKEAGVETTLVRMNEEWHGTDREKPTNWFRTYGYLSEWYEKYSKD